MKSGIRFHASGRVASAAQCDIAINGADGADGTEYRMEFDPTSTARE